MAVYFVGQYPDLYNYLTSDVNLESSKNDLSNELTDINAEMDGISVLLDELEGSYSGELSETFHALITELTVTYDTVNDGLTVTLKKMEELSNELGDFSEKDTSLENNTNELRAENDKSVKKYDDDNNVRKEWKEWDEKKNRLTNLVRQLDKLVKEIKAGCDDKIAIIDDFNNKMVEIRLSLASIAYGSQGYDLDTIKNLGPAEREKILKEIIKAMTEKYNEYKATYERYAILTDMPTEDKEAFFGVLRGLGLLNLSHGGINEGRFRHEPPKCFAAFDDLIILINDNNILDVVENYFGKNMSWEESGMGALSRKYVGRETSNEEEYWEFLTAAGFLYKYDKDSQEDRQEIWEWFKSGYDGFCFCTAEGKKYYQKTIEMGTAIKEVSQLRDHVKYDIFTIRDDYVNFDASRIDRDKMILELSNKTTIDVSKLKYMNREELKMLNYLYSQEKDGLTLCSNYFSSLDDSLNKREGYIKATIYYNSLMNGSNEGLESVWDHFSVGVTGLGDGLYDFCDGLVDLVAPSRKLNADEYAQLALLGYLGNDDGYSGSLNVAYSVGSGVGKEAIPTIISMFGGESFANGLRTASSLGNQIENYYRSEEYSSMDNAEALIRSYARAGIDLLATNWIDSIGKKTGLDASFLGRLTLSTFKTLEKCGTTAVLGNTEVDLGKELRENFTGWGVDEITDYFGLTSNVGQILSEGGVSKPVTGLIKTAVSPLEAALLDKIGVEDDLDRFVTETTGSLEQLVSKKTVQNTSVSTALLGVDSPPVVDSTKTETNTGQLEVTKTQDGLMQSLKEYDSDGEVIYDISFDTNKNGEKVAKVYEGNESREYIRAGVGGEYMYNGESYRWDPDLNRMVRI